MPPFNYATTLDEFFRNPLQFNAILGPSGSGQTTVPWNAEDPAIRNAYQNASFAMRAPSLTPEYMRNMTGPQAGNFQQIYQQMFPNAVPRGTGLNLPPGIMQTLTSLMSPRTSTQGQSNYGTWGSPAPGSNMVNVGSSWEWAPTGQTQTETSPRSTTTFGGMALPATSGITRGILPGAPNTSTGTFGTQPQKQKQSSMDRVGYSPEAFGVAAPLQQASLAVDRGPASSGGRDIPGGGAARVGQPVGRDAAAAAQIPTSFGSFVSPQIDPLINWILTQVAQNQAGSPAASQYAPLASLFEQRPGDYWSQIMAQAGQGSGLMNDPLFSQFQPQNLQYLAQYGLPGNQQVQQEQQLMAALSNALLGGTGGYGVTDLLSQVMNQGLPNQRLVEGLAGPQSFLGQRGQTGAMNLLAQLAGGRGGGQGLQDVASQRLSADIAGGGMSPEYVQSLQNLVFNPQREQFLGQLNQLGGGQVQLDSPAFQELMRRQERDFNDQLIRASFERMPQLYGLAGSLGGQQFGQQLGVANQLGGLGQQGIGNALAAFGAVPSAAYPFVGLAGNLGSDLSNQSLNRFATGSGLGLENLRTISQLGMAPYQFQQQQQFGGIDRQLQALQQLISGQMGLYGGQQQYDLGQQQNILGIIQALMGLEGAEQGRQAATSAGRWGAIGSGIGSLLGVIPWGRIFG